ncbi:MAG: Mov34/MPN/PAD-1 family protein [Kiritimatiellae bacterium]|nr:Mov34/MPN/PAD-1 family protein [Kiritimatiellia bacterium]
MSRQKNKKRPKNPPEGPGEPAPRAERAAAARVSIGRMVAHDRPVRAEFPGPRDAQALLRVAVERGAYADACVHAKESLDREVCGVLVGDFCEDAQGPFVRVQAVIRGAAAREQSAHVTFTQETWTAIHETLERDHPTRRIVGWYHSHPGFGVEFSDLDLFIQKNFFPSRTHIALVIDPLGGQAALCVNTEDGIRYLDRFWVDGREHRTPAPRAETARAAAGGAAAADGLADRLDAIETRLNQVVRAVDEQSAALMRAWMTLGFIALVTAAILIALNVYRHVYKQAEPPELRQYVPVPIRVGDKTIMVGLGVAEWEVPPELDARLAPRAEPASPATTLPPPEAAPEADPATAPQTGSGSATEGDPH